MCVCGVCAHCVFALCTRKFATFGCVRGYRLVHIYVCCCQLMNQKKRKLAYLCGLFCIREEPDMLIRAYKKLWHLWLLFEVLYLHAKLPLICVWEGARTHTGWFKVPFVLVRPLTFGSVPVLGVWLWDLNKRRFWDLWLQDVFLRSREIESAEWRLPTETTVWTWFACNRFVNLTST